MPHSMTLGRSIKKLFSFFTQRRRWQLAGLIVLMLIGALAEMATLGAVVPFLALLADPTMVDKYPFLRSMFSLVGGSENMLFSAALLFGIIAIVAALIRMLLMWVSLRFSFGLGADIGGEVYRRALYQPYSWHLSRNSSEILAGIDKVNAVVYNVITPLLQGVVSLVISIGLIATLIAIDTQTALIAGIGFTILYGLTTFVLKPQLHRNSKIVAQNVTNRVKAVQEGLGGIRDVLLDGTQHIYHRRFAEFDYAMRRGQSAVGFIGAAPRYIIEGLGMILLVGLAYWLAGNQGGISGAIPVLGAIAMGAQKLLPQMQLVYYSFASISGNKNQLADVLELLDRPIPAELMNRSLTDVKKDFERIYDHSKPFISLRDLSFSYKVEGPLVLDKINLDIFRGSRVGIIGKTGSGKSTLIDIIMGLLEPTSGHVEIDGQRRTSGNMRLWQKRIAHVPQMIFLSDTSLAENIAFGVAKGNVDMARVKIAAEKAQLSEFIESLTDQYQTTVGERGVRLSGGQRQRIGLARALYKQADVLVLDEATSALDDATEMSVMSAIQALGDELTVIMIAHRLSTLRDCDEIVELGDTHVLRTGSYSSIIERTTDTYLI
jgi:ABC-type multidrug transport system fused ATPase/permease subunit